MGCCSVRFAFAVAGSRAARSLLFSRWFSGLLALVRDPSHKTLLFTVLCCVCVSGLARGLLPFKMLKMSMVILSSSVSPRVGCPNSVPAASPQLQAPSTSPSREASLPTSLSNLNANPSITKAFGRKLFGDVHACACLRVCLGVCGYVCVRMCMNP